MSIWQFLVITFSGSVGAGIGPAIVNRRWYRLEQKAEKTKLLVYYSTDRSK